MRTWFPTALAISSGVSGWFLASSPYLFRAQNGLLGFVVLPLSSVLVWSFLHLLIQPFLRRRHVGGRLLVSVAVYLLIGVVAIVIVAASVRFSGALILIPFWPMGVVFILFGDRVYNPQELIGLLAAIASAVAAIGIVVGLLQNRRLEKEIGRSERQPSD